MLKLAGTTTAKLAAFSAIAAGMLPGEAGAMGSSRAFGGRRGKGNGGGAGGSANCFLKGTRIRTADGDVAIEDLRIGDMIETADAGTMPIRWIGRRSFNRTPGRSWKQNVTPIVVAANAIADQVPNRDVYLSPSHAIEVDGMLMAVEFFVNAGTIRPASVDHLDRLDYFHVELDSHEVIFADGLRAETLYGADRDVFSNFVEHERLYGSEASKTGRGTRRAARAYGTGPAVLGLLLCAAAPVIGVRDPAHRSYRRLTERSETVLAQNV